MTAWDVRVFLRAFGGAVLGLVVVWLVTAASDEGQLTVGARAGRTLPLAPLCSAVGAALALGTGRVREEVRALEALGRSPAESARAAALGAALPSIVIAIAIAAVSQVDVAAFYPRVPRGDTFVFRNGAFESTSLGVRIDREGETYRLEDPTAGTDDDLPRGARISAAAATGIAGLALALVAAGAVLRRSLQDQKQRRRFRAWTAAQGVACALLTLVAFQAAAVRAAPAVLAIVPSTLLLGAVLVAQLRTTRSRTT